MITGAFFIFRISPMDFTLGVFRRLTTGPKSIRDDINETTQRKKPGFFRREIMETQTILQATGKEQKFPALCAASLLLFAIGAGIAIVMNNFLLVPVLAAGMMFLPFWYIKLTAGHYKKDIAAELETALSIITTAYLRSENLQTAVEENINYLNPPVHGVFRSFLLRIKHIDPNMDTALAELKTAFLTQFPMALWETFYVTVLSTALAILLGLPLGVLLVAGEKDGVLPLPKPVLSALNVIINLLRSIPFLILMIMVFPLSRLIIGTAVGTTATIVPLVVAAFPFVARLVESSLREVDPNIIEAAQSMGATPMQIICKVMIPESVPSLIQNVTISLTTILGYSAMSGIIGGGGLGKVAIDYGYYRYKYLVMFAAVILLILLVQLFQTVGTKLAVKCDKRLKK
jgi:D-methionine transport system permease protein